MFLLQRGVPNYKVSLHNGYGRWTVSMTSDEARRLGTDRVVISDEPRPTAVDGWVEGPSLLVSSA